ncbi:MAG: glucose 1-dehydrogenase [Arenicellales bacterium]|nr:glucose 1-dehydrogenase [Arenicellales bacterium]
MNKLFDLSNKTAIITGASSGLGWRFSELLAKSGARLVIAARRTERLQELVRHLANVGGQVHAITLDVTDSDSITDFFDQCQAMDIASEILINNAGIAITKTTIEQTEADWNRVVDTNLKGAWLMSRELVRRKQEDARCNIVNVASVLGFRGTSHLTSYCASKAGLINLTRSLAVELAKFNVRVNAIAPGYIETDMNRDFLRSSASDPIRKRIPLRQFGKPEDLDGAILYLCSDASRYVNGAVITVDGGHSAGI